MDNKMTVTVSDINGIKQYNIPANIKIFLYSFLLIITLLLGGLFFYIQKLNDKVTAFEQLKQTYVVESSRQKRLEKELLETKEKLDQALKAKLVSEKNLEEKIAKLLVEKKKTALKIKIDTEQQVAHALLKTEQELKDAEAKLKSIVLEKQRKKIAAQERQRKVLAQKKREEEKLKRKIAIEKQKKLVKEKNEREALAQKRHEAERLKQKLLLEKQQKELAYQKREHERIKRKLAREKREKFVLEKQKKELARKKQEAKRIKRKLAREKQEKLAKEKKEQEAKKKKIITKKEKLLPSIAKKKLGKRYVWGAVGPKTFDCSGFTCYVYKKSGINIPRTSRQQSKYGKYVKRKQLKPGDLIFFDTSRRSKGVVNHVGIYIGNNKFIHASSAKKRVVITSLNKAFYSKRYKWARRIN